MRSSALSLALLCALLGTLLSSCKYDLDRIYEESPSTVADAGGLPVDLIDHFRGTMVGSDACLACARRKCRTQETACTSDPECAALMTCAAESVEPDALAGCRSEHLAWIGSEPVERWLAGPYYGCVFRESCDKECTTHTDWSCLGSFSWRKTSAPTIKLKTRFYDPFDNRSASSLHVRVCRPDDLTCATPVGEGDTDAKGELTLNLPTTPLGSFRGYLELTGNAEWYPTLVQFGWPLARDGVIPVPIVTAFKVNALTGMADLNPERGLLQLRMFGCSGIAMRGVSFATNKADAASSSWYFEDPLANFERTDTTEAGNGGIINVMAGPNTITAARSSDKVMVAKTVAPVRAGVMTIVLLSPLDASQ